jgi:hypothetical protein
MAETKRPRAPLLPLLCMPTAVALVAVPLVELCPTVAVIAVTSEAREGTPSLDQSLVTWVCQQSQKDAHVEGFASCHHHCFHTRQLGMARQQQWCPPSTLQHLSLPCACTPPSAPSQPYCHSPELRLLSPPVAGGWPAAGRQRVPIRDTREASSPVGTWGEIAARRAAVHAGVGA